MSSEFWSAIAGAVVGGIIALGIQLVALKEGEKHRQRERQERREALGYSVLFKLVKISSNLHVMDRLLKNANAEAKGIGVVGEPWQVVRPPANLPDPVKFSADEMAMVFALKDDNLFNSILSLDEVHNGTLLIFAELKARRATLTAMLPAMMRGIVGMAGVSEADLPRVRPLMAEINDLIQQLTVSCDRDASEASATLARASEAFRLKLQLAQRIELPP